MLQALVDALNRLAIEKQPPEDLPRLAAEALAAGVDSPSLRETAGTPPDQYQDARDRFTEAMRELGYDRPSPEAARWSLVRSWANAIVNGSLQPYEGSRRIWWEGWEHLGRPDELTVFVGLASQWEDDEERRPQYERDIIAAARTILGET